MHSTESRDEAQYEAIYNKYPLLFEKQDDRWNIEIGPMEGWLHIIDELFKKITKVLLTLPEEDRPKIHLDQIKEKFGRLTIYASFDQDPLKDINDLRDAYKEITELIWVTSENSEYVCEVCGCEIGRAHV